MNIHRFLLILVGGILISWFSMGCIPRVAPEGEVYTRPTLTNEYYITRDGLKLPVRRWPTRTQDRQSRTAPQVIIIGLHGLNDYSNAFSLPASALTKAGLVLYGFDQRGFGASPYRGLWGGVARMTRDVHDFTLLLHERYPQANLYLLGVSMGGAVALNSLRSNSNLGPKPPIAGAILVAPAIWARRTMPLYQPFALWVAAHTVPWLSLSGRGLKVRPSDNIPMLRALGKDPLIIKETRVDVIWGLANLMDAALDAASTVQQPLLILYGEKDDLIPRRPNRALVAALPKLDGQQQRLALYPGSYHMLLRGLDAETILTDIIAWVAKPDLVRLPSGADQRDHAASFLAKERKRGAD